MILVTERDARAQVAQVQVIIRAGSLSDPAGRAGAASLVGRALLRGTVTRPYHELTFAIERMGASVSVRTDQDLTVLHASVLARNLDPFLGVLGEILASPSFDSREVEVLKTTVQGELRASLQDPQELAMRALIGQAFHGTRAEIVPDGTIQGVSRLVPGELQEFFSAHYRTGNLVAGAVSALEEADLGSRIADCLGSIPEGGRATMGLPALTSRGRRAVVVDRKGLSTTPIYIAIPGVADDDPEMPFLELGNFSFGGDFTSRLMRVLRVEKGWTYGVSSGFRQLVSPKAGPGLFSIYLFPSAEFAAQAIPTTLRLLEEYARNGLSEEEFTAARQALTNGYPFQMATAEQRLALRVRQVLTGRPYDSVERYRERLEALSLEALNSAITRCTRMDPLLLVAVGDVDALRPVLEALPGMEGIDVVDADGLGL